MREVGGDGDSASHSQEGLEHGRERLQGFPHLPPFQQTSPMQPFTVTFTTYKPHLLQPISSVSASESQAASSHRAGVSCSITFRHQHPGGVAPPGCALMAQQLHRRQSEVQGRKVHEVTVEELADALALLQAKVVILGLGRR